MSEDNQEKLMNSCAGEIENFYRQALRCASFVSPPMDELLFSGDWYSSSDVYIRIDEGLHGSVLRLARKAVKSLGAESLGVEDFIVTAYKETTRHLAVELKEGGESRWRNFAKDFLARALEGYDVIFPCHSFEFTELDLQLRSKYVCVMPAKSFVEASKGQKYLSRIKLASEGGAWSHENFFSGGDLFIGGIIWRIKTDCPKDILPQMARWKAEVFISCLRLAMRPANNCTRARIGETEPPPIGFITVSYTHLRAHET